MEKMLGGLFDMQKFEKNPRLEKLINQTESRYSEELSDDALALVSAAGETDASGKPGDITGDFTGNYAKASGGVDFIPGTVPGNNTEDGGGIYNEGSF